MELLLEESINSKSRSECLVDNMLWLQYSSGLSPV